MAPDIKFEIRGHVHIEKLFEEFPETMSYGIRAGLNEAAILVQDEAKKRCPISPTQAEMDDQIMRRANASGSTEKRRLSSLSKKTQAKETKAAKLESNREKQKRRWENNQKAKARKSSSRAKAKIRKASSKAAKAAKQSASRTKLKAKNAAHRARIKAKAKAKAQLKRMKKQTKNLNWRDG